MSGPHIRTIIPVTRAPIRVETKVSAPRMSDAPIEANRIPSQDIRPISARKGVPATRLAEAYGLTQLDSAPETEPTPSRPLDAPPIARTLATCHCQPCETGIDSLFVTDLPRPALRCTPLSLS